MKPAATDVFNEECPADLMASVLSLASTRVSSEGENGTGKTAAREENRKAKAGCDKCRENRNKQNLFRDFLQGNRTEWRERVYCAMEAFRAGFVSCFVFVLIF